MMGSKERRFAPLIWKLRPWHMTGDTKYGTIENIKALEDAGIRASVPLPNWEEHYEV